MVQMVHPARTAPKARLSLSTKIFVGVALGAAAGLFFGERMSALQIVADAYIKLLQMTVLPYVTISIVAGLGGLNPAQARTLGVRVGIVLAVLWALALAAVLLFPLMFPPNQSASFFSTTLIQDREPFDFLNLYIPTNPFYSLANNVVPDRAVADGHVLVVEPGRRATGEHAEYDAGPGKIQVTGGPPALYDEQKGFVTGERLTFFVHDDRLLVDGGDKSPTLSQHRVAQ